MGWIENAGIGLSWMGQGRKSAALRAARRRQGGEAVAHAGPTDAPDPKQQIERINTLSQAARTTWFGLLSFLAFIGVTLMGVEDKDFFLPSNQNDLPLVGVSIPTHLVFTLAPLLGTAIFGYLHFHLLSLWQAIGEAPETQDGIPLSNHISPWLINEMALRIRGDGAMHRQPMSQLASIGTNLLVFWATPIVLVAFWWRSMPAHDEAMTVFFVGVPLTVAVYIAARSRAHLRRATGTSRQPEWGPFRRRALLALISVPLALFGWFRTEGTLAWYAVDYLGMDYDRIRFSRWAQTPFPGLLARADLAFVDFVGVPSTWKERFEDRTAFYLNFCAQEGLPNHICNASPYLSDSRNLLAQWRSEWCAENIGEQVSCTEYFNAFENDRHSTWVENRRLRVERLGDVDLSRKDLRGADLFSARLEGADLRGIRLDGADLSVARLEASNLTGAWLDGANFSFAILANANISNTRGSVRGTAFSDTENVISFDGSAFD